MSKGSGGSGTIESSNRGGGRSRLKEAIQEAGKRAAGTVKLASERVKQAVKGTASRIGGAVRGALSRLRGR